MALLTLFMSWIAINLAPSLAAVTGFTETAYTFSLPARAITRMAWAPDGSGRLFMLRKNGEVVIVQWENGTLVTSGSSLVETVFASEVVHTNSESGLLGIAFHPNYVDTRLVYFFLTASSSVQQIVSYVDVNSVGTSRKVVVNDMPTTGNNHNGGALAFGPDGYLYCGIGDLGNGAGVNADLTSQASKISRADAKGIPISSNPYNDGVGPNNEYIWARGFRNPFNIAFQPSTGKLWVNVPGTNYEQVFAVAAGDHAGYNMYENNQQMGYLTPKIAYRTNTATSNNVVSVERSGGIVTVTTQFPHWFRQGQSIALSGVSDSSFNSAGLYVISTPTSSTWTAAQDGPDATSTGGSANTLAFGGAITGGVFYDSTLFPADYRGNYFFSDYNSGILGRARFSTADSVAMVDLWGSGFIDPVSMEVGPDGALYVVGVTSQTVTRIIPQAVAGQLIVSALHVLIAEGGRAVFTVKLAAKPSKNVVVTVVRSSGDSDIVVQSGAALTFTPSNWNQIQKVTLFCGLDADSATDKANFTVSLSETVSMEVVQVSSIDAPATLSPTTISPTSSPTTFSPTHVPTHSPTHSPTTPTTHSPTLSPTRFPTHSPTPSPTRAPTTVTPSAVSAATRIPLFGPLFLAAVLLVRRV